MSVWYEDGDLENDPRCDLGYTPPKKYKPLSWVPPEPRVQQAPTRKDTAFMTSAAAVFVAVGFLLSELRHQIKAEQVWIKEEIVDDSPALSTPQLEKMAEEINPALKQGEVFVFSDAKGETLMWLGEDGNVWIKGSVSAGKNITIRGSE